MASAAVWMTLTTPKGMADLYLNDLPVARLEHQHALRMPLTEYVRPGLNQPDLRPARTEGRWTTSGEGRLLIEEFRFEGQAVTGSTVLLDAPFTLTEAPLPAGAAPVILPTFQSRLGAAPALGRFRRIDAEAQAAIRARLRALAEQWRRRDFDGLLAFLAPYIQDFTSAYASEDAETYRRDFSRMAAHFMERGEVDYDEAALDLDICGEGRLADCLDRRGGPAIKIRQPTGAWYDFNLAVAFDGRDVVAVR